AKVVTQGESPNPAGQLIVSAENRGDQTTSGTVTIHDTLPENVRAVGFESVAGTPSGPRHRGEAVCSVSPTEAREVQCTFEGGLPPFEQIEVRIDVDLQPGAHTGEVNTVSVSGGGAVAVRSASHAIEVDGSERFGVED